MNESFSDIFGISVEFYVGKDKKEDIYICLHSVKRCGKNGQKEVTIKVLVTRVVIHLVSHFTVITCTSIKALLSH